MSRGGYRQGSGRKAREGERRTLTLRLPLDCLAILDRKAGQAGQTRTDIVIRLLRDSEK